MKKRRKMQMKTKMKILCAILSFSMVFTLLLPLLSPIVSFADNETILISSADDFIDFAKNCSYDLWSKGKSFLLTADIDLQGKDVTPVPVFSGKFDGAGHTISGVEISSAGSTMGLFSILDTEGEIRNLTVSGAITPEGEGNTVGGIVGENSGTIENSAFLGSLIGSSDVGGIAGRNTLSGSIIGCICGGEIIGDGVVGGIAGRNEGLISDCVSSAKVNTIAITPTLSLDDINLSLTIDITKLPTLGGINVSDVGGIAGYSTGIIMGSVNNGRVGYPHVGYNVGGIVGRSSGHVNGCVNNVEIFGRKDVGGIVGHMEPYTSYELKEDLLLSLKSELDRLSGKLNEALGTADSGIPTISGRLDSIITNIDGATDSLDTIIGGLGDYGSGTTDEINRISAVLKEVLTQLSSVTSELPELSGLLSGGLSDLEEAMDDIDKLAAVGIGTIFDLAELVKDGALATESIRSALDNLELGLTLMKDALDVKDQAKAEAAMDMVIDGLSEALSGIKNLSDATGGVIDAVGDNAWMYSALDEAEKLSASLGRSAEALKAIYDAAIVIRENVKVNWSEIETAGDELATAIDCFAEAIANMDGALGLMENGLAKITDGMDLLLASVTVKDEAATKDAVAKLISGLEDLVNAVAKCSEAMRTLANSFSQLESGGSMADILDNISNAIGSIADGSGEVASSFSNIAIELKVIFENVELDIDSMADGGSLIIGGAKDMTDALRKMRAAISNMNLGMQAIDRATESLGQAVVLQDKAKIEAALGDLSDAVGTLADSAVEITEILDSTVKVMREAKLWGDNIIDATASLSDAVGEIASAMLGITDGIKVLRENVSLDLDLMKGGFEKIVLAISDTSDALLHVKNAALHLSDVLMKIHGAGDVVSHLTEKLSDAMNDLVMAMQKFGGISEDVHSIVKYLMGVDPIQLPTPPESVSTEADRLFIYISVIESELKKLNSDVTSMSSELVDILAGINGIFTEITDNIISIIYNLENGDILDNAVSESEIDGITHGKIFASVNNGNVSGDINVGGISGTMGIEYTTDPEDDLSPELSVTQKRQYRLKAVIHACESYGNISAKYDCVGGIVGKMDFGLIYLAEAYGSIASQGGSYVGGIAGITAGRISSCFAKCSLSGESYVGGIIGAGVSKSHSGDSSIVVESYTMVEIKGATQYFGAISGTRDGEYAGNFFISDSLQGIDRVSYGAKAEPIGYEELIKRRYIPDEFYGFTLKFMADGVVLSTLTFPYGDSIDVSEFPAIPTKEGHYGRWDRTDLKNLTFDTVVNVIYTPYVTAIAGGKRGDDKRDLFLVEGEFTTDDTLVATLGASTEDLLLDSAFFTTDSLVESWTLTIPQDTLETNRVHLLPSTDHARIFVKTNGVWQEVEAKEFGSYLTFDVSGDTVEIAVVRHTVKLIPIIIISAIALIAIASVAVVMIIRKKKTK